MRQSLYRFTFEAPAPGPVDVTRPIVDWVSGQPGNDGLLTLHVRHTSASLIIQENADPQVMVDLERFFQRLVPHGDPIYGHVDEGPDDMPAHVRSVLTATTLSIPVRDGAPTLGTWQGIYLYEHRTRPRPRHVEAHFLYDS